jgi:predicted ATP-grasp superfamily ATP-dependent carboligase
MKILVFEYITGGGFSQENLPASLIKEGLLMLEALLENFAKLPQYQLTILLDTRVTLPNLAKLINVIRVTSKQSIYDVLPEAIESSDLIWPIAPEINSALQKISELVTTKNKLLLNSSTKAVELCSDKLFTYQVLTKRGIATVETTEFNNLSQPFTKGTVVKPKKGVGCINSFFIPDKISLEKLKTQINNKSDYIIQPYIEGESLSLSCLFKEGRAWLLCCNRQQILIEQGRFKLNSCEVNIPPKYLPIYQSLLLDQVATAIPGLWGYVGIDIIQNKTDKPLILEINPRLTTSFATIYQALGINVAKSVLELIDKEPIIKKTQNETVIISI